MISEFERPFRGLYRTAIIALILCFLAAIPNTFDFLVGNKNVWLAGWLLIPVVLLYGPLAILARRARITEYRASGYAACTLAFFAAILPVPPVSLALLYFSIWGLKSLGGPEARHAQNIRHRLRRPPIFTVEEYTLRLVAIPAKGYIVFGILSIALGLPGCFALAMAGQGAHGRSGYSSRIQGDLFYLLAAHVFLSSVVLPSVIVFCGFRLKRSRLTAGYAAASLSLAAFLLLPLSPVSWGLVGTAIWTFVALRRRRAFLARWRRLRQEDDS